MGQYSVYGADVIVGIVLLVSASYAAYRGLMRETLSILAPAAAAYAALLLFPIAQPVLRTHIDSDWLAGLAAVLGVFLGVWVPLAFMTHSFSQKVQSTPLGPVDRILGFIFGIGRGLVILGIAYIVFSYLVPVAEQPDWLKQARSLPVVRDTSSVLLTLVPDNAAVKNGGASVVAPPSQARAKESPKSGDSSSQQETYGAGDRRALDRLIETTGGQ